MRLNTLHRKGLMVINGEKVEQQVKINSHVAGRVANHQ